MRNNYRNKLMPKQCRTPNGNIHLVHGTPSYSVELTTCKMQSVSVFSKFWNTM